MLTVVKALHPRCPSLLDISASGQSNDFVTSESLRKFQISDLVTAEGTCISGTWYREIKRDVVNNCAMAVIADGKNSELVTVQNFGNC